MRNIDESGKPAQNRGKAPHSGGYHSGKHKTGKGSSRIWFEKLVDDPITGKPKPVAGRSNWNPGKR